MPDRRPNQRSSIYRGQDGWWHGWVTLGIRDDGSPDRRHRMGRTEAEVTRKVRDLERARDTGRLACLGKGLTVGQWMEIWLTTIAPRRIRRSTLESTYTPKVRNRIIPGLGKHRLDRLTPEHIERFYTQLDAEGLAPATVLQIHRILSRALKVAMQRGYVAQNVATRVERAFCKPKRDRAADPGGGPAARRAGHDPPERQPVERGPGPWVAPGRGARAALAIRRPRRWHDRDPVAASAPALAPRLR